MTQLATRTLLVRSIPFRTLVGLGGRIGLAGGGFLGMLDAVANATGVVVREGAWVDFLGNHWLHVLVTWPLFAGAFCAVTAALAYVPLRVWMSKGMPVRMSFEVVVRPSERGPAAADVI